MHVAERMKQFVAKVFAVFAGSDMLACLFLKYAWDLLGVFVHSTREKWPKPLEFHRNHKCLPRHLVLVSCCSSERLKQFFDLWLCFQTIYKVEILAGQETIVDFLQ